MPENQPCIANTVKLYNGDVVEFATIDMTSYLDYSFNTALRYLKPIIKLIGHPILTTVNYKRTGAQAIYFVSYNKSDSKKTTAERIDQSTWDGRTLPADHKPIFDKAIEYYRQFEITAHDAWNLLQKLQEEQAAHEATKEDIRRFLDADFQLTERKEALDMIINPPNNE